MPRIYKVGISTIKEKSQEISLYSIPNMPVANHCLVSNTQMDNIKQKRQNPIEIRYSTCNTTGELGTMLRYINASNYIPNFHYYNSKNYTSKNGSVFILGRKLCLCRYTFFNCIKLKVKHYYTSLKEGDYYVHHER